MELKKYWEQSLGDGSQSGFFIKQCFFWYYATIIAWLGTIHIHVISLVEHLLVCSSFFILGQVRVAIWKSFLPAKADINLTTRKAVCLVIPKACRVLFGIEASTSGMWSLATYPLPEHHRAQHSCSVFYKTAARNKSHACLHLSLRSLILLLK